MEYLFVDTGAWYALSDRRDPSHDLVAKFFRSNSLPLLTTNFVFDELMTLFIAQGFYEAAVTFGEKLKSSQLARVHRILPEEEEKAWEIFKLYNKDKDFSFTDCTSFAIMQMKGIPKALTLDRHFEQFGFQRLP